MKLIFTTFLLFLMCQTSYSSEEPPTLEITKLEEGIYLHRSYQTIAGYGRIGSNGLIVIAENKAYIIDTPWSDIDTSALADWIKEQGYVLTASLSTHSHDDRAGSIDVLNDMGVKTFASALTNSFLEQKGMTEAAHSFTEGEFNLVPSLIEAHYPGAGHTQDNLVVWLPKANILFGGCLIKSLNAKSLGYVGEAFVEQWADSIDMLSQSFPQAKMVVPGHGPVGNLDLLVHTKKLAAKAASH